MVNKRVLSVDALRGAAILCIVGADDVALALKEMAADSDRAIAAAARFLGTQFSHAEWEGFHFYDLIFPLFLFAVGLSIPLSLAKARTQGTRRLALRRIVWRSILLFLLGIAYYLDVNQPVTDVRLMGVLQRIAICYAVAATLCLYIPLRGIVYITIAIIGAYALLLALVPAPGSQFAPYDQAMNLVIWVDKTWLPGRKHFGDWDPEGLLTTAPAIASCLLGVIAGQTVKDWDTAPESKSYGCMAAGICMLAAGYAVSWQVPIIKNLWTASYVLVAGGWSLLLFGLAHRLIDVAGYLFCASAAVWVGANAILIYLLDGFIEVDRVVLLLAGNQGITLLDELVLPGSSRLIASVLSLGIMIVLARTLYIRGLFLRL